MGQASPAQLARKVNGQALLKLVITVGEGAWYLKKRMRTSHNAAGLQSSCCWKKMIKVIVELHEGENTTTKLCRFNSGEIKSYRLQRVREDVLSLFPHLMKKGLTVVPYR